MNIMINSFKFFLVLLIPLIFLTACSSNKDYLVYVPNAGEGTVTVFDTSNRKVINTIKVGETASHGLAITPDNEFLYTGDLDGGNIYVIDPVSGKIIKTIEVGQRTHGIDISPDGKYVLVAAGRSGGPILAVIDTSRNQIINTISEDMKGPTHMSFSPDGKRAYIADPVANKVIVVNLGEFQIEDTWKTGSPGAQETTPSPDGKYLYVANYEGGTVSVIDTMTGKTVKEISTGDNTHAVAVTPSGQYLWVVAQKDSLVKVFAINENYKLVRTIDNLSSPNHLNFTPDGKNTYITDSIQNKVFVFDTKSYQEIFNYEVGKTPHEIDFVENK